MVALFLNEVSSVVMRDDCTHHNRPAVESVGLLDAVCGKSFIAASVYTSSATLSSKQESRFMAEPHISPASLGPNSVQLIPLASSLAMLVLRERCHKQAFSQVDQLHEDSFSRSGMISCATQVLLLM